MFLLICILLISVPYILSYVIWRKKYSLFIIALLANLIWVIMTFVFIFLLLGDYFYSSNLIHAFFVLLPFPYGISILFLLYKGVKWLIKKNWGEGKLK